MKTEGSELKFHPPKGYVPPEMPEGGKKFDEVCTFEVEEDGRLCLTMLGKTPLKGYEKNEEKKESKPDYSEYSKPMMGALGGQ